MAVRRRLSRLPRRRVAPNCVTDPLAPPSPPALPTSLALLRPGAGGRGDRRPAGGRREGAASEPGAGGGARAARRRVAGWTSTGQIRSAAATAATAAGEAGGGPCPATDTPSPTPSDDGGSGDGEDEDYNTDNKALNVGGGNDK